MCNRKHVQGIMKVDKIQVTCWFILIGFGFYMTEWAANKEPWDKTIPVTPLVLSGELSSNWLPI